MQNSFGWATAGHGYKNKTFPAAVGETGSYMSSAADVAMLTDMARYLHNDYSSLPPGFDYQKFPHKTLPNLAWWAWNANSGDTGGIVESDWITVLWKKVNWMVGAIHLTPWYMAYVSPQALPPTAKPPVEVGSQAGR
ncbi:hypothetical protein COCOBI_06-5380 [Coccomyxa sp. Obi]|nr:hypothetical protein COCOBI_06-5380 [Coccomyxa sp. Obi]